MRLCESQSIGCVMCFGECFNVFVSTMCLIFVRDWFPSSCHWSGISDEIFFLLETQGDCISSHVIFVWGNAPAIFILSHTLFCPSECFFIIVILYGSAYVKNVINENAFNNNCLDCNVNLAFTINSVLGLYFCSWCICLQDAVSVWILSC